MLRPLTCLLSRAYPITLSAPPTEATLSETDATLRKGHPDLDWMPGLRLPAPEASLSAWLAR